MQAQILIYASDDAPDRHAWAAAVLMAGDAYPRWWISAPTPEAARAKLEAFWEKERRQYEPRQGSKKTPPQPVEMEDPGDVI